MCQSIEIINVVCVSVVCIYYCGNVSGNIYDVWFVVINW